MNGIFMPFLNLGSNMNHSFFYITNTDVLFKEIKLILLAEILFRQERCNFLVNLC